MLDTSPSGGGSSNSKSPDTSFHTALGTPSKALASSTAASSPPVRPTSPYASSKELPRRLKEHCKIYLEEELYDTGLGLLNNVLFSAAARRNGVRKPLYVPPPSHLALLSTLLLHPIYTSRASDHEHARVPAQALAYLRNVLTVVGPVHANMRAAFQFVDKPRKKNRKLYADDEFSSDGETHQYHEDMLGRPMANESGLWHRGADFWTVLGWALRCSAAHPLRWPHWRRWLEFMVDVLKADWDERIRMDAAEGGPESGRTYTHLQDSIIVGYLTGRDGQCRSLKEVLRALFADGEKPSAVAFREVFYKELKVADPSTKRKREAGPEAEADLEAHRFGDYYFEEEEELSSDASRPSTPTRRRNGRAADEAAEKPLAPGMVESIPLRLRLLGLLSQVAWYLSDFFATPYDLYSSFGVHLNKLTLEAFMLFTSCQTSPLVDAAQCMMLKEVMPLLLPSSRRDPIRVDREIDLRGGLTQAMLEKCYLPYAAASTSVAENAKVSLALEGMVYLLVKHDVLEYSEELSSAMKGGIEAREAKVKTKRKKGAKMTVEDATALAVLKGSGQRLLLVLDVVSEKSPKEKDAEERDLLVGDAGAG